MTDDTTTSVPADCGGCSLHDALATPAAMQRREFLRAAGFAMASLGLLGSSSRDARAMASVTIAEVTGRDGATAEEKHYPMPAADGVAIDRDNSVIIARAAGKVYAFALSCPHRNTALRWNEGDHQFQCPKHHSRYTSDGTYIDGRATRNMDRLALRRVGNELIVDVDRVYQDDENPREWAAAFVPA
jgi:Rieske Fe-S protein